jgi:hypothetical protein
LLAIRRASSFVSQLRRRSNFCYYPIWPFTPPEIDLWEFFKTFAGPFAIIVASATAAWMTNKFGTIQAGIAREQAKTAEAQKEISKSQRDIAYDKLKHDLFDKRYEVYSAAKSLIEEIFAKSPVDEANLEIKRLRLKLDEARFFFPSDTRAFCESIEKHVFSLLVASHAARGYSEGHPERQKLRDKQAEAETALASIYPMLAEKFERDLGFDQLT